MGWAHTASLVIIHFDPREEAAAGMPLKNEETRTVVRIPHRACMRADLLILVFCT